MYPLGRHYSEVVVSVKADGLQAQKNGGKNPLHSYIYDDGCRLRAADAAHNNNLK